MTLNPEQTGNTVSLPELIFLDTGCLLNLYASRNLESIMTTISSDFAVADYVLDQEAIYVWSGSQNDESRERTPVNIVPLIQQNLIRVESLLSESEKSTFIDLAARMDDGEAITGALAIHRNGGVATDDVKARRILTQWAVPVPVISTLDLVKQWAELAGMESGDVRQILQNIYWGATYFPGRRDPLYDWWRSFFVLEE